MVQVSYQDVRWQFPCHHLPPRSSISPGPDCRGAPTSIVPFSEHELKGIQKKIQQRLGDLIGIHPQVGETIFKVMDSFGYFGYGHRPPQDGSCDPQVPAGLPEFVPG